MATIDSTDSGTLVLDLDPQVARQREDTQAVRLNTLELPQRRALGLMVATVLVWLHAALLPGSGEPRVMLIFSVATAVHVLLSWGLLRWLYVPGRRSGLGTIFQALDMLALGMAVWCSGAERSWLFLLPLAGVADQIGTTRGRVIGFSVYAVAVYAGVVAASMAFGNAITLELELLKVAIMLLLGLGFAGTAGQLQRQREATAAAMERTRAHFRELEARAQERSRSHADVQAASRARNEFVASMSHEIRTPMNGILGMLELVLSGDVRADQTEMLRTAHVSTLSLLRVVDDILDFSTVEAGQLELVSEPFDLRATVTAAVESVAGAASEKLLRLEGRVDPAAPATLVGDAQRLGQVLHNLLDNAVKFTPQGQVECDVDVSREDDGAALLKLAVRDTGIGISPSKQAQIFEPFTQADSSPKRIHGGTGLGLALTSQLVEWMGGTIRVESAVGEGSCFHVSLRCGLVEGDAAAPVDAPASVVASAPEGVADHVADHADHAEHTERGGPGASAEGSLNAGTDGSLNAGANGNASPNDSAHANDSAGAPPAQASAPAAGAAADDGEAPSALTRRTERPLQLLLVEDNKVNQLVARRILATWGHSVDVADNGRLGLDALAAKRYDAVLMDIAMPVMDGFEATRKVRLDEQRRGGHQPIIAMTAHASSGDRERCLDGGMDDYVTKPIQPQVLFEALERVPVNRQPAASAPIGLKLEPPSPR